MSKEKYNKNTEISARIAEILQYTRETRNGFAVKLGYERAQTVYDIMNMKSAPSYDFFRRFSLSEFSDIIDLKWLLSGEGSMLRSDSAPIASVPSSTIPSGKSDAVILRLMDKLDEKDILLKEKETKIDQLQTELRSVEKELAILQERNAQCDLASDHSKGLDSAKNVSTSKRSSSKTDDAGSADVQLK